MFAEVREPPVCRGFTFSVWCCWCLLQGDRDGGGEQIEGLPLRGGGEGDLVDLVAADGDGLAGEGGQVIEQVAEAAGWLAAGGGFAGGLGDGGA
jgi:hypothetical protein